MKLDEATIYWEADGDVKTVVRIGETKDVELVTMSWDPEKKRHTKESSVIIPDQRFDDIIAAIHAVRAGRMQP